MPAAEMGNCQKIRHIVRIRQMLKRWRRKAHTTAARGTPSDVPAGHVAVCVGASYRRFIVPATHLNHPIFKRLLVRAEEEYGFANIGPLTIPCDESLFEEIVRVVTRFDRVGSSRALTVEDFQRCCHVDVRNKLDYFNESQPLLYGVGDKSVC